MPGYSSAFRGYRTSQGFNTDFTVSLYTAVEESQPTFLEAARDKNEKSMNSARDHFVLHRLTAAVP
jgi:hypothetical protein